MKGKEANKDISRCLALGPENYFPETFEQTSLRRDEMVCDEALGPGSVLINIYHQKENQCPKMYFASPPSSRTFRGLGGTPEGPRGEEAKTAPPP